MPGSGEGRSYPGWVPRLARLAVQVFFRRIEVTGALRVPSGGPLLYVANHNNGLVDPVLVVGYLPGRPRFLAKSTLWRNPVLRPFLALGRVIPVRRRDDPGFDPRANEEAFERCRRVLAAGGAVALFPEGRSHSEPRLAEMRTGAARIVAGLPDAVDERLRVVPVGLLFDAKHRFRSQVLVKVGEPFSPLPALAAGGEREGVRRLTARIAEALAEVTIGYPSWEEARLVERAVDLYLLEEGEAASPAGLGERFFASRAFVEGYERLLAEHPERLAGLRQAVAAYDRLLGAMGLTDPQVATIVPPLTAARFVAETVGWLLFLLPAALIGMALNYPPYRLCGWLGALVARQPDHPASYKLFGGLVLYPLFWIGWGLVAARLGGPWAGLGAGLAGPAAGYVALRFRDRLQLLLVESRAWLKVRLARRRAGELRARRREVRRELLEVAAELTGGARR